MATLSPSFLFTTFFIRAFLVAPLKANCSLSDFFSSQVFVKSRVTSLDDSPHLSEDERQFRQLLRRPDVFILFPTKTSVDAAELFAGTKQRRSYVLVVLDGTWREAKKMYFRSPVLQVAVVLIEFSTDRMSRWSNP